MKPFAMKSTSLILSFLSIITLSTAPVAAKSTSIFIDQIPLYSRLASCAEDRVSAIIRAQFSGCGDNMQLTSFSCFCIDSSTEFNSILSTAVEEQCALTRTGGLATITKGSPEPEVTKVQELFASYCSKSTLLTDLTSSTAVATGTQGPQTATAPSLSTATSTSTNSAEASSSSKGTPVAAIVVPCVVVPLALIAAGAFFFIRRRRSHTKPIELADSSAIYPNRFSTPKELVGDQKKPTEMGIGEKAYAHELGPATQPAELQGGSPADWKQNDASK